MTVSDTHVQQPPTTTTPSIRHKKVLLNLWTWTVLTAFFVHLFDPKIWKERLYERKSKVKVYLTILCVFQNVRVRRLVYEHVGGVSVRQSVVWFGLLRKACDHTTLKTVIRRKTLNSQTDTKSQTTLMHMNTKTHTTLHQYLTRTHKQEKKEKQQQHSLNSNKQLFLHLDCETTLASLVAL